MSAISGLPILLHPAVTCGVIGGISYCCLQKKRVSRKAKCIYAAADAISGTAAIFFLMQSSRLWYHLPAWGFFCTFSFSLHDRKHQLSGYRRTFKVAFLRSTAVSLLSIIPMYLPEYCTIRGTFMVLSAIINIWMWEKL